MPNLLQRLACSLRGAAAHDPQTADPDESRRVLADLDRRTAHEKTAHPGPSRLLFGKHGTLAWRRREAAADRQAGWGDVSRLGDGTVLTRSPRGPDLAFVTDCLAQDVRRVVDLRSSHEKMALNHGPFDGAKVRTLKDPAQRLTARISRIGKRTPLQAPGSKAAEGHVRSIAISMTRGADNSPESQSSHSLKWIRVHAGSGGTIPPRLLLDTSAHLALTAPDEGGRTMFVCHDGRHTGATFAAADALLRRHLRQPLSEHDLAGAVVSACHDIRVERDPTLFRAGEVASLLAFGHLMLEADRRGELGRLQRLQQIRTMPKPALMASSASTKSSSPAPHPWQTPPPRDVLRTFETPPVDVRPSGSSAPETFSRAAVPRSVLKQPGATKPANTRRQVTFSNHVSVRHLVDTVEGDESDAKVTRVVRDGTRRITAEDGPRVPPSVSRSVHAPDGDGGDV